ncbi:hypothetical protein Tco_0550307 [Tanacetum coccineum]
MLKASSRFSPTLRKFKMLSMDSVGPKMTRIKTTQIAFQYDIASLNTGIADVKSSSHIASISPFVSESSLDKKETPSHFKGEQADMATEEHKEEKVTEEEPKNIATESDPSTLNLVKASMEVHPDPNGLVLID